MFRKALIVLTVVVSLFVGSYFGCEHIPIRIQGLGDKFFSVKVILINTTEATRKVTLSHNIDWEFDNPPDQVTLKPKETIQFERGHHPELTDAITFWTGGSSKTVKIYGSDTMLSYNDIQRTVTVTIVEDTLNFTVQNHNDRTGLTTRTQ